MDAPPVPDATDLAILRALVADGRMSLQDVADKVGLRRPSVHARVRALEAAGVIRGYHADVAPDAVRAGLAALVSLRLDQGREDCASACARVATALRALPNVLECHTIAGDDDLVLKVRVADVRELEDVVMRRVSGVPGVARVRTSLILSTQIDRPIQPPTPRRRG